MRYRETLFYHGQDVRDGVFNIYRDSGETYSPGFRHTSRSNAIRSGCGDVVYRINVKVKDHVRKETVSELPSRR